MKKYLLLTVLVFAAASMLQAAPVTCPTTATLAQLISLSGANNGCLVQDKLFNNFTYSTSGSTAASDVGATLVFQAGANMQDIHGWIFAPSTGPWSTGFTLGYTISVAAGSNATINTAKDQSNTGILPNPVVVTDTQTTNAGTTETITTRGATGQETAQVSFSPSASSITTSSAAVVPSGSILQSYEQDWFESASAAAVPEPSTMAYGLLGAGFLVLGLLRFKKS